MIFLEISYFYIKLQAMRNSKKKNSRKNKFKIITFKLSARQYDSLKNYSTLEDTTPIKVIKKPLNARLLNNVKLTPLNLDPINDPRTIKQNKDMGLGNSPGVTPKP
mgnify:CR=1 FL=1